MPIEKREGNFLSPWLARTQQEGREVARAFKTRAEAREWLKDPVEPTWWIKHLGNGEIQFVTFVKVPDNPPKPGGGWDGCLYPDRPNHPAILNTEGTLPLPEGATLAGDFNGIPMFETGFKEIGDVVDRHVEKAFEDSALVYSPTIKNHSTTQLPPPQQTLQVIPADFEHGGYVKGKNKKTGRIVTLTLGKMETYYVEGRQLPDLATGIRVFQQALLRIGANHMEKVPRRVRV